MKLEPRTASTLKMKTVFVYTAASIALFGVILSLTFLYLNFGNSENAFAKGQNYSSRQTGNWIASSSWNGAAAPPFSGVEEDNIIVNSGHTITLSGDLLLKNKVSITINSTGKLIINGNLTAKNEIVLMVNGELSVSGDIVTDNGSKVTINSGGKIAASGNVDFKNNADLAIDGTLSVGNNLSFGNNPVFTGSGTVSITGNGCDNWQGPGQCNEFITLPIELLAFEAENVTGGVELTWKTATELNNDYFTIERSSDGIGYSEIATVKGSGTSKEIVSYDFTDTDPLNGRSYYRLTQTDFDGKFEVFKPVAVDVTLSDEPVISVSPNPITGNTLYITLAQAQEGALELLDSRGNKVLTGITDGSSDNIELAIDSELQPGFYYLKYKTATVAETVKLVKRPQ